MQRAASITVDASQTPAALAFHEGPFDHVVARRADARRHGETARIELGDQRSEHGRAAAQHGAIPLWVQCRQADVERKSTRSEEHTSELQSRRDLVCRLLLEKKKNKKEIE